MTLNQRLTNKAKKQLIAANKKYPNIVGDIRVSLKKTEYVIDLPLGIGCNLCTYVFDSHLSSAIIYDAFKPISE